jgi:hypothetical protein
MSEEQVINHFRFVYENAYDKPERVKIWELYARVSFSVVRYNYMKHGKQEFVLSDDVLFKTCTAFDSQKWLIKQEHLTTEKQKVVHGIVLTMLSRKSSSFNWYFKRLNK